MTQDEESALITKAKLAGECGCAALLMFIAGLIGWLVKGA